VTDYTLNGLLLSMTVLGMMDESLYGTVDHEIYQEMDAIPRTNLSFGCNKEIIRSRLPAIFSVCLNF
jgi:hypothetical protein